MLGIAPSFERAWSDFTGAEWNFRWAESGLRAELSGSTLSDGARERTLAWARSWNSGRSAPLTWSASYLACYLDYISQQIFIVIISDYTYFYSCLQVSWEYFYPKIVHITPLNAFLVVFQTGSFSHSLPTTLSLDMCVVIWGRRKATWV